MGSWKEFPKVFLMEFDLVLNLDLDLVTLLGLLKGFVTEFDLEKMLGLLMASWKGYGLEKLLVQLLELLRAQT